MKVSDVMTRGVISLTPEDSVLKAARLMMRYGVSGFPVLDRGRLVGIITQGDFLRRVEIFTHRPHVPSDDVSAGELAAAYVHAHARKVGDVMTRDVITVSVDTPLAEAIDLMEEAHVKRLPVVRGEALVGLITRANLLHAFIVNAREPDMVVTEDDSIRERLVAELDGEPWASAVSINIFVHNGHVDLQGVIADERQRLALRVAAENVQGVRGVRDHLRIAAAEDV
jgi:CBS domain-containing protein